MNRTVTTTSIYTTKKDASPSKPQAWAVTLLIFAMIYQIPAMPGLNLPLPIIGSIPGRSPVFLLTAIIVLLSLPKFQRYLPAVLVMPEFMWLTALYGVLVFGSFLMSDPIESIVRIVTVYAAFVALLMYMAGNPSHIYKVASRLLAAVIISQLWYALEMSIGDPFIAWRQALYSSDYAIAPIFTEDIRSGLTPFVHQLGYQAIPAVVLMLMLGLVSSGWRRLPIWVVSALLIALLFISGQRSAVLGSLISILIVLILQRRQVQVITALLGIGLVLVLTLQLYQLDWERQVGLVSLEEKLLTEKGWADIIFRLQLQWEALRLIWQNPFGLDIGGVSWDTTFWRLYNESQMPLAELNIADAVHNGYLIHSLKYGVLFLFGASIFLVYFARTCLRLLRWNWRTTALPFHISVGVPAAALALFFPQALTHNGSIFARDPNSVIIFALLLALEIQRRGEARYIVGSQNVGVRFHTNHRVQSLVPESSKAGQEVACT